MKKNKMKNTQLADQLKSLFTDDYITVKDKNKRYTQMKNPYSYILGSNRRMVNFYTMANCLHPLKIK